MQKIFISYSHKDIDVVSSFAGSIASPNIDIWIDEKSINKGQRYVSAIFDAIRDSDIYMLFMSPSAFESSWVMTELDFAINETITRKDFQIIPILLEDCNIPASLSTINYIDARNYSITIAESLKEQLGIHKTATDRIQLSTITFEISEHSDVEIGPLCPDVTIEDLENNTKEILEKLRKKAQGILINFVSISELDLHSEIPRFKNGIIYENITKASGSFNGGIKNKISIVVTAFNPNLKRLTRLLTDRLEILRLSSISFTFTSNKISGQNADVFAIRCFERIQDMFTILSYDIENGAKIEYTDDVYIYVKCTTDGLSIKFQTKYDFQFEKSFKEFPFDTFIKWLIN